MKKIIFLFAFLFTLNLVSSLNLECPSQINYGYFFSGEYGSKAKLQVSYDPFFSRNSFKEISVFTDVKKILMDYGERTSEGYFYARISEKINGAIQYSNVCKFKTDYIQVISSGWSDGTISSDKSYKSKNSLKIVHDTSQDIIFFPYDIFPDLSLPINAEAKIHTPEKCEGTSFNKNYLQILYSGTVLFRGPGWKNVKLNNLNFVPSINLKIGTFGKCDGNFYIDNVKIYNKDSLVIWNFE